MKIKICKNCGIEKEVLEFYKDSSSCKECAKLIRKEYYKKYPWKPFLNRITQRCTNINSDNYKWYGLKGIKCNITSEELKFLWFRDKAYDMDKPSIDRKDNDGNYTLDNCQFIEMDINRHKDRLKPIIQYSLTGYLIASFESATQANKLFNANNSHITQVCKGIRKTAYGFIWRYKYENNLS